jgi:cytochrome c
LFCEHSVVYGFLLYLLLSIFSFIVTSKSNIEYFKFGILEFVFLSILVTVGSVFTVSAFKANSNAEIGNGDLVLSGYDIQEAKTLFMRKCGACHKITEEHSMGPSLNNIISRSAGSYTNYEYSVGLANAKFIWTEEKLKQFLENQNSVVPSSRMILAPITEKDINVIVEFLVRQNKT